MKNWIQLVNAEPALMEKLHKLAVADNHSVVFPTHVMVKKDEITGYLSVGAVPNVGGWFSQQKMNPRDSFQILNVLSSMLPTHIAHVPIASPMYKSFLDFGYRDLGGYQLLFKRQELSAKLLE
jgi:hypothetical protein